LVAASSAEEALTFFDDGLVVEFSMTDHLMQGMSGSELARKLRRAGPTYCS